MFTGIIEEVGTVKAIEKNDKASRLIVSASKILEDVKLGDSISTNGVCLTVSKLSSSYFQADVMAETLRRSSLGTLKTGSKVNLERALSLKDRLGGHIVTGHIDGTGEIVSFEDEANAVWVTIKATSDILRLIVEKGSISIDGISLTVAYVDTEVFKVSIIPHTGEETTLLHKAPKDIVNLECDVIGKYVEKLLGLNTTKKSNTEKISLSFLESNGFL